MQKLWRVAKRVLKWSGITVLALVALAFLLFAVALLINARDEQLSPQARALLAPPPNPYKPEDNIYLALVGADARPGEPVIAAGLMKISAYNERVDALMRTPTLPGEEAFGQMPADPHRLAFQGDCSFVKPRQESLWQSIPPHGEQVEKLVADNGELYRRYLALHGMEGYYETARPSWLPPPMPWPACERKVFLAEYVLRMRTRGLAERRQALTDLLNDVQLWSRVFKGEGAFVSKLLSVVYLQEDYLLLADTIADPQVAMPVDAKDADSVIPLSGLRDWDLGGTFAAEFRVSSSIMKQTDQLSKSEGTAEREPRGALPRELTRLYDRVGGQFFKLNATENLLARQTERRIWRARDPRTFFKTTYDSDDSPFVPGMSAWEFPRRLSYNPIGKVLAAFAEAAYEEYPPRVWDAAALQRLVRVGYEIRRQRIAAGAIPTFLAEHPQWSTHPADGRPFLWDAKAGELRIQTVGKQRPDRRFSIRVWQVPPTS